MVCRQKVMKRVSSGLEGRGHQVKIISSLMMMTILMMVMVTVMIMVMIAVVIIVIVVMVVIFIMIENSRLGALSLRSGAPSPDTLGEPH